MLCPAKIGLESTYTNISLCIFILLLPFFLFFFVGATVKLDCDGTWAVLIVTGLMKRVHSLLSSSEIVFLDTTASCEGTNSSLTVMLVATKAGAVPIAAFIHENQTSDSYVKAFSMLKMHFPLCFGGKEV